MEKETFIKYVEMLHRFEKLSKEELSIYSNADEIKVMTDIRNLVENDPELMELLKQIHSLPDNERMRAVMEYFSKKENKEEEEPKTEEEEIAKTFGVDVDKIEHKFLSNGKEIFSFYDNDLGRQVVLENNKKGKSLVEYLEEIQEQNEEYQTEDAEENSNNILKDQNLIENIELKMLTKEEILNRYDGFNNVDKEDAAKLRYLLDNYEKLNIKGINLENLIYIDEDNQIHEAVINEKQEVAIATPIDANYDDSSYDNSAAAVVEPKQEESNDLAAMMEESTTEEKDSLSLTDGEYEDEQEKSKPKVLTKEDKYGFINNVLFVAVLTAAVLTVALIYFLVKYYS